MVDGVACKYFYVSRLLCLLLLFVCYLLLSFVVVRCRLRWCFCLLIVVVDCCNCCLLATAVVCIVCSPLMCLFIIVVCC